MHSYTHEYVLRSLRKGTPMVPVYVGSTCQTEGCPDRRKRVSLPVVAAENSRTHRMFSRRNSRVVVK